MPPALAEHAAGRAAAWRDEASGAFLDAYRQSIEGCATWPQDRAFRDALLDLFLIQKAAYEVSYELANRPAWVDIPLAGLLRLVERREEET